MIGFKCWYSMMNNSLICLQKSCQTRQTQLQQLIISVVTSGNGPGNVYHKVGMCWYSNYNINHRSVKLKSDLCVLCSETLPITGTGV